MKKSKRERKSHWRLKHTRVEIRFGPNDIMSLSRFGLLVPAQHKFHWSHMESGLLLDATRCVSAESSSSTWTMALFVSVYLRHVISKWNTMLFKWWAISLCLWLCCTKCKALISSWIAVVFYLYGLLSSSNQVLVHKNIQPVSFCFHSVLLLTNSLKLTQNMVCVWCLRIALISQQYTCTVKLV